MSKQMQGFAQPRRNLDFACSRRKFLPSLLREAIITLGMLRGGQGCRLSDLGSLPDGQLAEVRPLVSPACEILMHEGLVSARHRQTGVVVPLFAADEREKTRALELFDGNHTLAAVGERLAQEMGWDGAEGYAQAREFFLFLVGQLVCFPRDPILPPEPVPDHPKGRSRGTARG
jgi:hypothetical protein